MILLLAAYGLTFALMQDKIPGTRAALDSGFVPLSGMLNRMLQCAFCTGFHSGWVVSVISHGFPHDASPAIFALASASFCFLTEALLETLHAP